jgi:hypothetical protein
VRAAVALAALLAACTYDYSRIPRADAAASPDARGAFVCDPFTFGGCTTGLTCASFVDPPGTPAIRCAIPGSVGPFGPCSGTGECVEGLVCLGTAGGSATCQTFCTESTDCSDGRTCDRSRTLFADGARRAHPCI